MGLLTIVGVIFFGFRRMLVSIWAGMASLKAGFISIPHLIAYIMFFIFVDLFRYLATDRIIRLLVKMHNPASDEDARDIDHNIRFGYLLGI